MFNKSKKRKEKIPMVIGIIAAIIVIAALVGVIGDGPGRREISELTFSDLSFKNLKDGTYVGEYKGTKSHLRDTKVEVTVSGNEITDIKILKGAIDKDGKPMDLKGGLGIDDLFNKAIQSETLGVDVISGATVTSKSHLKALEDALMQAQP